MNSFFINIIFAFFANCFVSFVYAQKSGQINIDKYISISSVKIQDVTLKKFVDLKTYLPRDYVVDGSVDYTTFIQKGVDENQFVLMPNFPVLINDSGIVIKSNKDIYFQTKSALFLKSSNKGRYSMFDLKNSSNVKIYNPTLIGDRNNHIGEQGEWGMGINVYSSTNIKIFNPEISNCWGDGIYIGGDNQIPSKDVLIEGGSINYCRRNGISITNGENVNIRNIVVANTIGTAPMCGIDLEPNSKNNKLKNIKLESIQTLNNADVGIAVNLSKLDEVTENNFELVINGHKDVGSKVGIGVAGLGNNKIKTHYGLMKVVNSHFLNNRAFEIWSMESNAIQIRLVAPKGERKHLNAIKSKLKTRKVNVSWNDGI